MPPLAWDTVLPAAAPVRLHGMVAGPRLRAQERQHPHPDQPVAIAGDTVQITSATDLPASGVVVGYAFTADGTIRSGGTAHWGLLRDSDPFVGS